MASFGLGRALALPEKTAHAGLCNQMQRLTQGRRKAESRDGAHAVCAREEERGGERRREEERGAGRSREEQEQRGGERRREEERGGERRREEEERGGERRREEERGGERRREEERGGERRREEKRGGERRRRGEEGRGGERRRGRERRRGGERRREEERGGGGGGGGERRGEEERTREEERRRGGEVVPVEVCTSRKSLRSCHVVFVLVWDPFGWPSIGGLVGEYKGTTCTFSHEKSTDFPMRLPLVFLVPPLNLALGSNQFTFGFKSCVVESGSE